MEISWKIEVGWGTWYFGYQNYDEWARSSWIYQLEVEKNGIICLYWISGSHNNCILDFILKKGPFWILRHEFPRCQIQKRLISRERTGNSALGNDIGRYFVTRQCRIIMGQRCKKDRFFAYFLLLITYIPNFFKEKYHIWPFSKNEYCVLSRETNNIKIHHSWKSWRHIKNDQFLQFLPLKCNFTRTTCIFLGNNTFFSTPTYTLFNGCIHFPIFGYLKFDLVMVPPLRSCSNLFPWIKQPRVG